MSTFSWIGNKGTNDPNDATQAANWLLVSGTGATPTDGDTVNIGTGATLDATNAGSISSFTIVAAGTDTFNFTDQNFTKQSSLTLGDQTTLNLVGHLENNGTIGTNGTAIAGFDINPNGGGGGGNNSQIHLSDMGSSVTINASGALSSDAFIYIDAKAAKLAINVNQTVINSSTLRGDFYLRGPILDTGGTLTISSDNTSLTGLAGNRFSNAGYILIGSQNAISSAKLNARMDGTSGVIELAAGLAGSASLEINTNMPGSQIVEFGGPQTSVTIDATNTLASYGNVGTVATTVLQNQFERFNLFGPGDTIDIANVAITSYSFGKDATWGNNVLTLFKGGTTVGRLRFTSASAFADGTSSNFVLSSDGASGTNITVSATPVSVVNSGTTYSVGGTLAVFNGPTASATLDWGTAANWTGGTGIGGLPGQYQATHITNSLDQLSAFASYVLNVSSAATSGGLSVDDHFLTLNIAAPLTLAATPGQGSGGGLAQTAGTIDITAGGTLAATNALLAGGGSFTIDSKGVLAVTGNPAFTSGSGLLGIDTESDMHINGGTVTSGGAFIIGQNAGASVSVQNAGTVGASITASYTTVGQSSVTDLSQSTGQSVSTLSISGANTTWKDAGGDATTNLSGGMLVGGGGTGVNALGTVSAQTGGNGNGQLTIDSGASVTEAGFAILGVVAGSSGQAYVQNNAHWTIGDGSMTLPGSIVVGSSTLYGVTPAELTVGLIGQGSLNIISGATVAVAAEAPTANQFSVSVGHGSSSGSNTSVATGVLSVDSALLDSHLGAIGIGNRGQGTLNVSNGGTVLASTGGGVTAAAIIGNNSYTLGTATVGSNGQLNIGGTIGTALFSAAGSIIDGKDGVGTITVNGGGSLSSSGVLFIGGSSAGRGAATDTGSTLDLEQGAIGLNAGTNMANGILSVGATATITAQGNGNTTRAKLIDNANFGNGAINNLGLIQALGGTLEIQAGINGAGTLLASSSGALMLDRAVASNVTVSLGGTASVGVLDLESASNFAGTITNFWGTASGLQNQIDVHDIGTLNQSLIWTQTTGTSGALQVIGNLGAVTLQIAGFHPGGFTISGDGIDGGIVFARDLASTDTLTAVRVLNWTGNSGTSLINPNDWNDATDALNPATFAPGTSDTANFLSGGGANFSGTLSVNNANFSGGALWSLANGVTVAAANVLTIGQTGTVGTVQLNAANAVLNAGTLNLVASGNPGSTDTLDLENGAINIGNTGSSSAGNIQVGASGVITMQGSGAALGAVIADNAFGGGVVNAGTIQALNGTLELMTSIAGSGVERATSGGTLKFDRSVSSTSTVALGGTASFGTVELATMDTFQATLTNFWSGAGGSNQVNVDNVGSILVDSSWNQIDATYGVLNFTASKGIINSLGSLTIAGYHALGFSVAGSSTINGLAITALDSAPCYAEGTRILTAHGEVPVETLAEGDLLPTLLHGGGLAPVKWIGVSAVRLDGHPDPDRAAPIRIRAGALSQGVPHRDLRLSPEHAMLIDGVLVPASLLVNGASIIREPAVGTVRYFHIELERHDAILAEGAAGETYLDTGNRDQFDNGGTVRQLHPAFDAADRALAVWASESAAPILLEGEALAVLHARLATRAALLGYARTADPALSLQAGGQTLKLTRLAEDLWQASLPAGAATLRLCSRSFVPSADDRRAEDHRSLGVAVADLLLDGVALADNCFAQGFHAAECDASGSWRWTDGAGLVRLAPAAQPRRVTLRLRSGWVKYWAAA